MRKISNWAKDHVWQARLSIVIIYVLLNLLAYTTGTLLKDLNILLPDIFLSIAFILTILLFFYYPEKILANGKKIWAASYRKRKFFDFSLALMGFIMSIYLFNHGDFANQASSAKASFIKHPSTTAELNQHPLITEFISLLKSMDVQHLSNRQKIKLIKDQVRKIKHSKDVPKENKGLLIALSVLAAIGLLIGLGALSCSIACGGADALAIVVAVAGTFLIIFFLVRIIKKISRGKPVPKESK